MRWLIYTLVRLATFAVILVVLLLFRVDSVFAAVIAALAALAISYFFYRRLRDGVTSSIANRGRGASPRVDDAEEDALDR